MADNIEQDAEWERMEPLKLYELNREKNNQNPDLKKRLIATAPHRLIEASTSKHLGGGLNIIPDICCHIFCTLMSTGIFPTV